MRIKPILVLLAILVPAGLFATGVHVKVVARIPLIIDVKGPAQVVLAPGEVTRIHVGVMANVPWLLAIHSPNESAQLLSRLSGAPGSAIANDREVEISCSEQASGPQTIDLIYTVMPR